MRTYCPGNAPDYTPHMSRCSPHRSALRAAPPASALAYHATAAHDLPRALEASLRAAAEARASRAPAEASVHLAQALSVWDAVPGAAAVAGISRIRLGLQAATAAVGRRRTGTGAVALAQEAVDLAETAGDGTTPVDAELVALCLTQLASFLYLVDRDVECYRASSRARELLRGRDLSQTVVQAAAMYARAADGLLLGGKTRSQGLAEVRASAEEALHGAHELSLNDVEADWHRSLSPASTWPVATETARSSGSPPRATSPARAGTTARSCGPSTAWAR